MAIVERDELKKVTQINPITGIESENLFSGLRIGIRATTASLADYHDWNVTDVSGRTNVVSDGACS